MHEKIRADLRSENELPPITALERELIKGVEEKNDFIKSVTPLETFWQDKNNRDSVITSTILGRKDQSAKEFEFLFKSINEDSETKAKTKEDFKTRMTAEFEKNPDYYAKQAIARAESLDDLFHIFDQFKKNEQAKVVIGQTEKEELKEKIKTASEDIIGQVQRGELVNPDLEQIGFVLSSYDLPGRYNIVNQLAKIIKHNLGEVRREEITPFPVLEQEIKPQIETLPAIPTPEANPGIFGRLRNLLSRRK